MIYKDSKGFSLVELIVVIAIMALLTSVLVPQYIRYVRESEITMDVANADQIADAVSAALADETNPLTAPEPGTTLLVTSADLPNVVEYPEPKVNPAYTWVVTVNAEGVERITLGGYQIWPDADDASDGYRVHHN